VQAYSEPMVQTKGNQLSFKHVFPNQGRLDTDINAVYLQCCHAVINNFE
jgi:hypothetical protein